MNRALARATAGVAVLLALLGSAGPVLADCVQPPPIEQAIAKAELVFVGTVLSLSQSDRWATVAVEEVWAGPDLGPMIELRGGPAGNSMTSVDRTFTAGTRYLFFPYIEAGALQDNSCTSTTEFRADHAKLRPAAARPPVAPVPEPGAGASDLGSLLLPAVLVVAAATVVFGAALLIRRS